MSSSGLSYLEDVLINSLNRLERCLPYGDLAGEFLAAGIVTHFEYCDLKGINNEFLQRREVVLKICKKPPVLIEKFCYCLKNHHACADLGVELLKDCALRKHELIKTLREELEIAKGERSKMSNATPATGINSANIIELEETCSRLKQQLFEQKLETQKWKDAYDQVEKDLKAVQGRRSPSVKRLIRDDSDLLLGIGRFGMVHRIKFQEDWCAGKTIHNSLYLDKSGLMTRLTVTCNKFVQFRHPHVETFLAIQPNSVNVPVLLTEICPESLDEFVRRYKSTLPFSEQLRLIRNIADGLFYLHQYNIVHANLHGGNVLITGQHLAKVADYICPQLQQAGIIRKTPTNEKLQVFIAPELSKETVVPSFESDVFSLGALFVQVLTQDIPASDTNLVDKVHYCNPVQSVVDSCLSEESTSRPDCVRVCDLLFQIRDSPQYVMYNCFYGKKELPTLTRSLRKGDMKWVRLNNLPVRMHSAYVVRLGNCLYVTGGVCSSDKPDVDPARQRTPELIENVDFYVFEFNLFHGNWAPLPLAEHKSAVPHIVGDKLVLFGGLDLSTNKATNQVSTYDTKTDSWTKHYPDLKECRCFPAVVSWGEYVIVAGGKQRDDIEVMHTMECQWSKIKISLPRNMFSLSATISNDTLYLTRTLGGFPPSTSKQVYTIPIRALLNQPQNFEAPDIDWSPLPEVPYINATIVPDAYPPMIVGGSDPQGNTVNGIMLYDVESRSWKQITTMSYRRANSAVVNLSNHALIVVGGCSESKTKDTCKTTAMNYVELGYVDESP